MVKIALVGVAALVIWLLYSASAPWLKRYAIPADACARWSADGVRLERPFLRETGHGYVVPLSQLRQQSDDSTHGTRSEAILCEGEKVLGPPHGLHDDIRSKGNGLYSLWSGVLYFSTSDNSDPNQNGRPYYLVFPPMWYKLIFRP
jgi:hypothetical protein